MKKVYRNNFSPVIQGKVWWHLFYETPCFIVVPTASVSCGVLFDALQLFIWKKIVSLSWERKTHIVILTPCYVICVVDRIGVVIVTSSSLLSRSPKSFCVTFVRNLNNVITLFNTRDRHVLFTDKKNVTALQKVPNYLQKVQSPESLTVFVRKQDFKKPCEWHKSSADLKDIYICFIKHVYSIAGFFVKEFIFQWVWSIIFSVNMKRTFLNTFVYGEPQKLEQKQKKMWLPTSCITTDDVHWRCIVKLHLFIRIICLMLKQ